MAKARSSERIPELREFIKENDQRLYDFCMYMLHGSGSLDDLLLWIFRDFGDAYRKLSRSKDSAWEHLELRIRLFQIAWEGIRDYQTRMQHSYPMATSGRDTRPAKHFDGDILTLWRGSTKDFLPIETAVLERLARIDADFRAPVVLRDILGFDDEEVVRILAIRWGVYRHRLHRGRLDYKDGLRGRTFPPESPRGVGTHP